MYKHLLFDLDNTLLDFDMSERFALEDTLLECPLGFNEEIYEKYHRINIEEWKKHESGLVSVEEVKLNRYLRLFSEYGYSQRDGAAAALRYENHLKNYSFLMPDASEVLTYLSKKYNIYIVTNGIKEIQTVRLAKTDFNKYIKAYFISGEIGYPKPEKYYFDYVISSVGDADLKNYLLIGDSLTSDIKGANNYGIDCCYFNLSGNTDSSATYNIKKLSELYSLL